jgi:hypothetical protein
MLCSIIAAILLAIVCMTAQNSASVSTILEMGARTEAPTEGDNIMGKVSSIVPRIRCGPGVVPAAPLPSAPSFAFSRGGSLDIFAISGDDYYSVLTSNSVLFVRHHLTNGGRRTPTQPPVAHTAPTPVSWSGLPLASASIAPACPRPQTSLAMRRCSPR